MNCTKFIRGVKQLGFSLGEIGEILSLRDRGEPPCRYVAERLDHRSREVDRQIRELGQLKRELSRLRERSDRLGPRASAPDGYCHVLEGG